MKRKAKVIVLKKMLQKKKVSQLRHSQSQSSTRKKLGPQKMEACSKKIHSAGGLAKGHM